MSIKGTDFKTAWRLIRRREMSNGLKRKMKIRQVCHKCNERLKGKHYMVMKPRYGWVCPECGHTIPVEEWIRKKATI